LDNCSPTANCDFERLIGLYEWDTLKEVILNLAKAIKEKSLRNLKKEDGNVESALVLIPMLILFLIGMQLIVATNIRNAEMALAQGDASARAISHQYQLGDEVLEVGGRIEKIQVLITHRTHLLPQIVPGLVALMGGNPVSDVVGIAVIEPSNY
jgi:hypothetical protein